MLLAFAVHYFSDLSEFSPRTTNFREENGFYNQL